MHSVKINPASEIKNEKKRNKYFNILTTAITETKKAICRFSELVNNVTYFQINIQFLNNRHKA